jgi:hypothetical protein
MKKWLIQFVCFGIAHGAFGQSPPFQPQTAILQKRVFTYNHDRELEQATHSNGTIENWTIDKVHNITQYQRIVQIPDLTLEQATMLPSTTVASGANVTINVTDRNVGTLLANAHSINVYFFVLQAIPNPLPTPIYTQLQAALTANNGLQRALTFQIPSGHANGQRYILLKTDGDNAVTEGNENNNTIWIPITIRNCALTVNSNITHDLCANGRGSIAINSVPTSVPPLQYQWSNGANAATINNLNAGNYIVTITDANNCPVTQSFDVTAGIRMTTAPNVRNERCPDLSNGSIDLNVNGGTLPYRYTWNNGSTNANLTNLSASSYQVTVKDANDCEVSTNNLLITAPPPVGFTSTIADETCLQRGSITLNMNNGTLPYTYIWSHNPNLNQPVANNLIAGNYAVTVTDDANCTKTQSFVIRGFTSMSAICTPSPIHCNQQGSIAVTAEGGTAPYTYTWNHTPIPTSNPTVSNLLSGTYVVTVTDRNGCTVEQTATIAPYTPLNMVSNPVNQSDNGLGSIQLSVTGGRAPYQYRWNHPAGTNSPIARNLEAGTYTVTVTDADNCTKNTTIIILDTRTPTNVSIVQNGQAIEIAPNPSFDQFVVSVKGLTIVQVTCLDEAGKTMAMQDFKLVDGQKAPLPFQIQAAGNYVLVFKTIDNQKIVKKIVKY